VAKLENMNMVFVCEPDSSLREILCAALRDEGLAECCTVGDVDDIQQDNAVVISMIGAVPGLKISEADCFEKPVRLGAVLDRVWRHVGMNKTKMPPAKIQIGPYYLDCIDNTLRRGRSGDLIRLTEKERHILEFLAAQNGKVVDRVALLGEVWGYAEGLETHTLETHIYRLRQKIEKDPAQPRILLTEASGYKINL
jgi:DNA-binding response OmpR family regulator